MTNKRNFAHDNKNFEIRAVILENRYCVKVYLNNTQVSPEYSATLEVGNDFFHQHQESIVNQLLKIAEEDVQRGIFLH